MATRSARPASSTELTWSWDEMAPTAMTAVPYFVPTSFADSVCERSLIAASVLWIFVFDYLAARYVDNVDSALGEGCGNVNGIVDVVAALSPVGCGDPHRDRALRRPDCTGGVEDSQWEAHGSRRYPRIRRFVH